MTGYRIIVSCFCALFVLLSDSILFPYTLWGAAGDSVQMWKRGRREIGVRSGEEGVGPSQLVVIARKVSGKGAKIGGNICIFDGKRREIKRRAWGGRRDSGS